MDALKDLETSIAISFGCTNIEASMLYFFFFLVWVLEWNGCKLGWTKAFVQKNHNCPKIVAVSISIIVWHIPNIWMKMSNMCKNNPCFWQIIDTHCTLFVTTLKGIMFTWRSQHCNFKPMLNCEIQCLARQTNFSILYNYVGYYCDVHHMNQTS